MDKYEKYDQGTKSGFCYLAKSEATLKKFHQLYNYQLSKGHTYKHSKLSKPS